MESPPVKRLYRSRKDQMLTGVCGGLGEYLSIDPTILRVIWLLFGLTGTGIVAYLIAWIIIPLAPDESEPPLESGEPSK